MIIIASVSLKFAINRILFLPNYNTFRIVGFHKLFQIINFLFFLVDISAINRDRKFEYGHIF